MDLAEQVSQVLRVICGGFQQPQISAIPTAHERTASEPLYGQCMNIMKIISMLQKNQEYKKRFLATSKPGSNDNIKVLN